MKRRNRKQGSLCSSCMTSAVECQHKYVDFGEWCCSFCRTLGPVPMHIVANKADN